MKFDFEQFHPERLFRSPALQNNENYFDDPVFSDLVWTYTFCPEFRPQISQYVKGLVEKRKKAPVWVLSLTEVNLADLELHKSKDKHLYSFLLKYHTIRGLRELVRLNPAKIPRLSFETFTDLYYYPGFTQVERETIVNFLKVNIKDRYFVYNPAEPRELFYLLAIPELYSDLKEVFSDKQYVKHLKITKKVAATIEAILNEELPKAATHINTLWYGTVSSTLDTISILKNLARTVHDMDTFYRFLENLNVAKEVFLVNSPCFSRVTKGNKIAELNPSLTYNIKTFYPVILVPENQKAYDLVISILNKYDFQQFHTIVSLGLMFRLTTRYALKFAQYDEVDYQVLLSALRRQLWTTLQ